jgi:hypothetical protein
MKQCVLQYCHQVRPSGWYIVCCLQPFAVLSDVYVLSLRVNFQMPYQYSVIFKLAGQAPYWYIICVVYLDYMSLLLYILHFLFLIINYEVACNVSTAVVSVFLTTVLYSGLLYKFINEM